MPNPLFNEFHIVVSLKDGGVYDYITCDTENEAMYVMKKLFRDLVFDDVSDLDDIAMYEIVINYADRSKKKEILLVKKKFYND